MNKKFDSTITMYNNMDQFHKVEEKKPTRKWERESLHSRVSLQI